MRRGGSWRGPGLAAGLAVAVACGPDPRPAPPGRGSSATVLIGAFRGPYTVLGVCGNCETQDRFFVEATQTEVNVLVRSPVSGQALMQAQVRCRALGRFVDHEGSCGDGRCRSFLVEAIEPP